VLTGCVIAALSACSTFSPAPPAAPAVEAPVAQTPPAPIALPAPAPKPAAPVRRRDGPPTNLAAVPDATPKREPVSIWANQPYAILGTQYVPMTERTAFKERGVASWYGPHFHGKKTATGETYNMYAMTAAHPTLPIPSYARVTNLKTGKSVVVRVNDRGPFRYGRAIDLSYTAAYKLGYARDGFTEVEVELITFADMPDPKLPVQMARAIVKGVSMTSDEELPASGIFLQLGTFRSRDGAEAAMARLARELDFLAAPIVIWQDGGLFKVQAGPYAQRGDALADADRIEKATSFRPPPITGPGGNPAAVASGDYSPRSETSSK
jgi:rare lipoprotein A